MARRQILKFFGGLSVFALASCSTAKKTNVVDLPGENILKLTLIRDDDDPDSANWYVDGMVGDRPYRFLLDTGAGLTTIVADDYLAGFTSIGSKGSAGAFEKTKYDLIVVPNVRAGSLSKSEFKIARAPKDGREKKNVLGMNFFKDNAFLFLFDAGEVKILRDGQAPEQLALFDLFMGENSHPYVDLTWPGDIRAKGVWDTGAGMTVFDSKFIKKHSQLFKLVGTSIGTDSTGAKNETPVYEMKGFALGGRQFPVTRVVGVDLSIPNSTIKMPMDFILGYPVLHKANWFFDFRQRKWAILKMLQ